MKSAAIWPCQCSSYHSDEISVNHLLTVFSSFPARLMPYPLFYVRALLDADAIECQEVAVKRSNRPRRAGKYRGWGEGGLLRAPEAECCVLLNLIPF